MNEAVSLKLRLLTRELIIMNEAVSLKLRLYNKGTYHCE